MINRFTFTTKNIVLSALSLMTIGYLSLSMVKDPVHETVTPSQTGIAKDFKFPIQFEQNEGQTDTEVRYLTRGPGYTFYFMPQEIAMVLTNRQADKTASPAVLKMQFVGANSDPIVKGVDELRCKSSYFIGNDKTSWHSNISNYRKVAYKDLYPGIDAIFYGNPDQLEYDLCVAPGANPSLARLRLEGAEELLVDKEGNLCIHLGDSQELHMQKPFVYQLVRGEKIAVDAQFTLLAKNEVGFELGHYDRTQELVIDPVLAYSTYLGGSGSDYGNGIAVDSNGNIYVAGSTRSVDFPVKNAFQASLAGNLDVFITKFDSTGTNLIYSTYLGGNSNDDGLGIAVDSSGNAYVVGATGSSDFPVKNAFQASYSGFTDVFITKLDATGSDLVYSTYLGGSSTEFGRGIAVDGSGNAYVTGYTTSTDFPVKNAFQASFSGFSDVFVTKLDATGSNLVYSTYLGGNNNDRGLGIAINGSGCAYVTGYTTSTNFPVKNAFQSSFSGSSDAFITKLDATGSDLIYSTYLGGTDVEQGQGIAVDGSGNAYVTGFTTSTNFPVKNAFQSSSSGSSDAFITKLDATGSNLVYSTYLGGNNIDQGQGIAVDDSGHAYVTGYTTSTNFPVKNAFQASLSGSLDVFVTKLDVAGSNLVYSTYLGGSNSDLASGIALDSTGNAYLVGRTASSNFPVTADAFQSSNAGDLDVFISKFVIGTPVILSMSPAFGPETGGTTLVITGVNFSNTTMVDFGGIAATFVIDSDTQITAISPSGTGTVSVTVTGIGGTSVPTSAGLFSYQAITTSIAPPSHLKGKQETNRFLSQTDFLNRLTWNAPSQGLPPVAYKIYRDASLKHPIATISSDGRLEFVDHNRKKGQVYTYYVVSIDQSGHRSTPAVVRIGG